MKRQDIINAIASKSNLSKTDAETALKSVESTIKSALTLEGEYTLQGVGILKAKQRAARTGRNPKTGEPLQIAASKAVTFTTAKALKVALNP
jgi:DNA-binding protein HU-beta